MSWFTWEQGKTSQRETHRVTERATHLGAREDVVAEIPRHRHREVARHVDTPREVVHLVPARAAAAAVLVLDLQH
eukprot:COSAG03_NODE_13805_length_487_cov_91.855670_1_plen_74_part_10